MQVVSKQRSFGMRASTGSVLEVNEFILFIFICNLAEQFGKLLFNAFEKLASKQSTLFEHDSIKPNFQLEKRLRENSWSDF